jgi:hypothetical protein|tara:strand:- start:581 stop:1147 length:567 start_codon:yes stop_codon:yes gene_type:complete
MKDLIKKLLKEGLLPESIKGGSYDAFHGSPIKINKFIDDFVGGENATDQEGPGIYFSTSQSDANSYGENIYNVTLTPRIFFDESPVNPRKLRTLLTKLTKMAPNWKDDAQNYDENPSRGLLTFIESTFEYNDNEKDCLLQVWIEFYKYNTVEYVRNCVKLGIDGIIVNRPDQNVKHFIVYNPEIITVK